MTVVSFKTKNGRRYDFGDGDTISKFTTFTKCVTGVNVVFKSWALISIKQISWLTNSKGEAIVVNKPVPFEVPKVIVKKEPVK